MTTELEQIAGKLDRGERLDMQDGMALLGTADLWELGRLAHRARLQRHGDKTFYNRNRHLNYTNLCALSCKFCAFYRKKDDPRGGIYAYEPAQAAEIARQAAAGGATEIHIVGGLHPTLPFAYYTDMLAAIRAAAPGLHIKAFTAVEIVHLSRIDRRPGDLEGVLRDLRAAGLNSLPGGGAEVFDERVHDQAFKGKIRGDRWLAVHEAAHRLGLMSNATILYGHIETREDRVNHLLMLREAQDRAVREGWPGRFQTVIPLPFVPDDSELQHLPGPTGLEDLRMIAVCRLLLDNFAHVKAFWIMQTLPLSQVALQFGADDLDGTVVWYDITRAGGAPDTHQEVDITTLRRTIRDAGLQPQERDSLYQECSG